MGLFPTPPAATSVDATVKTPHRCRGPMSITAIGVSHRTAPIEVRERPVLPCRAVHGVLDEVRRAWAHRAHTLANKLSREPIVRLQRAAGNGRVQEMLHHFAFLFHLEMSHSGEEKDGK